MVIFLSDETRWDKKKKKTTARQANIIRLKQRFQPCSGSFECYRRVYPIFYQLGCSGSTIKLPHIYTWEATSATLSRFSISHVVPACFKWYVFTSQKYGPTLS